MPSVYRLDDLTLHTERYSVERDGVRIDLPKLSYELLLALVRAAPSLLTHEDIVEKVWAGRVVSPETITQRIKLLRDALGDDALHPRYIGGVRGRGYHLLPEVAQPLLEPIPVNRPRRRLWVAGVAALVVVLLVLSSRQVLKEDLLPSVAVLPFIDMSPQSDQQYLADGIAEELLNELAGLNGLDVASRTSSFSLRGTNESPRSIGKLLGVETIIEGSVRKADDRVKITAQLIDVADGYHIWSEVYDREMSDIFAIEEEIARSVAGALGVALGVGDRNQFRGAGTRNIEAYETYLKAMSGRIVGGPTSLLERAVQLDPNYAAATAMLGLSIASKAWGFAPQEAATILERGGRIMRRAVELDPESARARSTLGSHKGGLTDWIGGEDEHAKALSLRPDDAIILIQYGNLLLRAGRIAAGRAQHEAAESIEPVAPPPSTLLHNIMIAQRRFGAAEKQADLLQSDGRSPKLVADVRLQIALSEGDAQKLKRRIAEHVLIHSDATALYASVLNSFDSRESVLSTLRAYYSDDAVEWPDRHQDIATLAAYFGDAEFALEVISDELRHTRLRIQILWHPVMASVRRLPDFKELVTELNLVAYWRTHGWADSCRALSGDDFICS